MHVSLTPYEEILALGWIPRKQSIENETKSYPLLFGLVQFLAWVKWVSTIRSIVLLDVCFCSFFFFGLNIWFLKMIFCYKTFITTYCSYVVFFETRLSQKSSLKYNLILPKLSFMQLSDTWANMKLYILKVEFHVPLNCK